MAAAYCCSDRCYPHLTHAGVETPRSTPVSHDVPPRPEQPPWQPDNEITPMEISCKKHVSDVFRLYRYNIINPIATSLATCFTEKDD